MFLLWGKRGISQFIRKNDSFRKLKWIVRFYLAKKNENLILVHQMGKVGSSTIVASLKSLGLPNPVYHTHTLTKQGIMEGESIYREMYGNSRIPYEASKHLLRSKFLLKELSKGCRDRHWKVVTLIRDPVARNISDFFQLRNRWFSNFLERYKNGNILIDDAIKKFLTDYHHDEPLEWFDKEIKNPFGIDIFKFTFPKEKGYHIYSLKNVDILILKLEKLNKIANKVFYEFLGIEDFKILSHNISNEKEYALVYKRFKDRITFPEYYLNKVYKSKYTRQFYTEREIEEFRARWGNSQSSCIST